MRRFLGESENASANPTLQHKTWRNSMTRTKLHITSKTTTLGISKIEKPHSTVTLTADWSMNKFAKLLRVFAGR
jgi:hypothetical protein